MSEKNYYVEVAHINTEDIMKISSILLGVTTLIGISTATINLANPIIANAENNRQIVYTTESSGEINFDSEGNILHASNPDLTKTNTVTLRTAENNQYGRWVYYSEWIGKWRKGHSNFYSTRGRHHSWVKMGTKSKTYGYANAHVYSTATQQGSGTFQCGYGLN